MTSTYFVTRNVLIAHNQNFEKYSQERNWALDSLNTQQITGTGHEDIVFIFQTKAITFNLNIYI